MSFKAIGLAFALGATINPVEEKRKGGYKGLIIFFICVAVMLAVFYITSSRNQTLLNEEEAAYIFDESYLNTFLGYKGITDVLALVDVSVHNDFGRFYNGNLHYHGKLFDACIKTKYGMRWVEIQADIITRGTIFENDELVWIKMLLTLEENSDEPELVILYDSKVKATPEQQNLRNVTRQLYNLLVKEGHIRIPKREVI